jgi:uncharacterized protein (TIGR02996 family)
MTDGADILAKVLAEPADDTARLVYADWLEEHGGQPERAEFIRAQVAWRLGDGADRIYDLLQSHWHEWMGRPGRVKRFKPYLQDYWHPAVVFQSRRRAAFEYGQELLVVAHFVRGFVWEVDCEPIWWWHNGGALAAAHPVEFVELSDGGKRRELLYNDLVRGSDGYFRHPAWPRVTFSVPIADVPHLP